MRDHINITDKMKKTKEDFIEAELNTNRLTPIQWQGILKAMEAYAEYYYEEKGRKEVIKDKVEEFIAKYWYETEYSSIVNNDPKKAEESRLKFREWGDKNLNEFLK